jgi:GNAT superfamily N-acetyltransferase
MSQFRAADAPYWMQSTMMGIRTPVIRDAGQQDEGDVWAILEPVIRSGETYTLPQDMTREAALSYWFSPGHHVFVAEVDGEVLGTYFLRPNQQGGGAHVANCGYITHPAATGKGVASAMCSHSLEYARARGFLAMQFNFVVSTNERAVRLWQRHGFDIVGRLPGAFKHPHLGYVDVLVMYRRI